MVGRLPETRLFTTLNSGLLRGWSVKEGLASRSRQALGSGELLILRGVQEPWDCPLFLPASSSTT